MICNLRVDVRGILCPFPVQKADEGIRKLKVGEILGILATDPAAKIDIAAWVMKNGHELL